MHYKIMSKRSPLKQRLISKIFLDEDIAISVPDTFLGENRGVSVPDTFHG
jgi:hypothetical protein